MDEQQLLTETMKIIIPLVIKHLTRTIRMQDQDLKDVSVAIERQLIAVSNWSNKIAFYGLPIPNDTEKTTIPLEIDIQTRRFKKINETNVKKQEADLITEPNNVMLLGEPGSGKTTTLKRIALLMLSSGSVGKGDIYEYPLVVELREMPPGESLYSRIAKLLGLNVNKGRMAKERFLGSLIVEEEYIGDDHIEDAIPYYLNNGRVLLLLDGLDEVGLAYRDKIKDEIENLGLKLNSSKIIVTCRTGDYSSYFEGFSVLKICPLTEDQIIAIKNRWLGEEDSGFVEKLKKLPYFDVANRPLMLTQLLIIYQHRGDLPDRPSLVYRKMIDLLLEKWDQQRRIKRISKYDHFDTSQKAEFLAALAYRLTYSLQKTRFSVENLISAYLSICNKFGLPKDEAEEVVSEIQTHTGIILQSENDTYEFSHLSLQEYLCAEYLVKAPMDTLVFSYLSKYTNPLAIAVALSSEPSNWLASFILNEENLKNIDEASMLSFLSRLETETPQFDKSDLLGFAIIWLFNKYGQSRSAKNRLLNILRNDIVFESLGGSLRYYIRKPRAANQEWIRVDLDNNIQTPYKLKLPEFARIPKELIPKLKILNPSLKCLKPSSNL